MTSGRVLGLDLGDAHIGVAISDEARRVAVPLGTVPAGAPQDLKAIAKLIAENDVTAVVVGHPISMSGARGARAHQAEEFAGALRSFLEIPVELHDERLSTVEADRALVIPGLLMKIGMTLVRLTPLSILRRGSRLSAKRAE